MNTPRDLPEPMPAPPDGGEPVDGCGWCDALGAMCSECRLAWAEEADDSLYGESDE